MNNSSLLLFGCLLRFECLVPDVGEMYLKYTSELLEESIITKSNVKSMTEKAIGAFCHDFTAGAKIFNLARQIEFDFQKRNTTKTPTSEKIK